jgi:pimeloyl-ACP methyl ester carboxylesterase
VLRIVGRVAIVAAVLVVILNWTWGRLPKEPEPAGRVAQVGDTKVHYLDRPGTGTPVVLIHGLPGTTGDFEDVMPRLRGRRTIVIDRPGYGFSGGGFHDFDEQVETVDRLLAQLRIPKAVVVGHSYGGTVALGLAERHPERVGGLVLVAPAAGGMTMGTSKRVEARALQVMSLPVIQQVANVTFAQAARTATGKTGLKEAFDPDPVDPEKEENLLAVTMKPGDLDAVAGERLEANDSIKAVDDGAASIRTRTVVIQGDGDKLVPPDAARTLEKNLPNARLTMVPGGHMVPYVHPEVVAAAVREFR